MLRIVGGALVAILFSVSSDASGSEPATVKKAASKSGGPKEPARALKDAIKELVALVDSHSKYSYNFPKSPELGAQAVECALARDGKFTLRLTCKLRNPTGGYTVHSTSTFSLKDLDSSEVDVGEWKSADAVAEPVVFTVAVFTTNNADAVSTAGYVSDDVGGGTRPQQGSAGKQIGINIVGQDVAMRVAALLKESIVLASGE